MFRRWRNSIIEECVQLALAYRDMSDARLADLDADGCEQDGSKTVGDPDWSFGRSYAANDIAVRLRNLKAK